MGINRNTTKKIICTIFFIFAFCLLISTNVFSANIYVDRTLSSNITNGSYSIATRDNSGFDGNAFRSVQEAVNTMSGGDNIYIRGGTYYENVFIPKTKDGTNSNWSSIQSYPGEWAIINGKHNKYYTLGNYNTGSKGLNDIKYWKIERLEITGGTRTDRGGGFCGNGGPFIIRYCYFHDNICASNSENPGGIRGYCWQDSLVEYCWFKNNGSTASGDNSGDITIFADYRYKDPGVLFNTGPYEGYYRARNEYKYNYFESGVTGIRQKSHQDMCDGDFSLPNPYQNWGEKIHHNVFYDYSYSAIQVWQDFCQVHNNITVGEGSGKRGKIQSGSYTSGYGAKIMHFCWYNNTLMGASLKEYAGRSDVTWTSHVYAFNNIVDGFSRDDSYSPSIHWAAHQPSESSVNFSNSHVDKNYIYRTGFVTPWLVGGPTSNLMNTAQFNSAYSVTNYKKSSSEESDSLYMGVSGTDYYKTRGDHVISGDNKISNGGIGGNHPYLADTTIPSYVGATNPNDNVWVDGVLGLANVTTLRNAGTEDPDWIEGGGGSIPGGVPGNPGPFQEETISP